MEQNYPDNPHGNTPAGCSRWTDIWNHTLGQDVYKQNQGS